MFSRLSPVARRLFPLLIMVVFACSGGSDRSAAAEPAVTPSSEPARPAGGDQSANDAPSAEAPKPATPAAGLPADLPNGLLLSFSQFIVKDGKATAKPGPARLELLTRSGGEWKTRVVEDKDSNVFHKAMMLGDQIVTLGGTGAYVKVWSDKGGKLRGKTVWHKRFGGKFDRMRDAEVADLYGDGKPAVAVATHDQGVVAILKPGAKWAVSEIDKKKDTFVHEIEIGDVDGDGTLEVYATPSDPNRLDAESQHGEVVRYVPKKGEGRKVVADLGDRHAKEILVDDVDGDGRDELYVAVEAKTTGRGASLRIVEPVEIRRYDADTPPDAKVIIATIPDRLCRFLTAGDVDGDGKKEMVAASFSQGLFMLRPGKNAKSEWGKETIDRQSGGFEHAALLTDLDGDKRDELYVAADTQGELRRYVWVRGRAKREVIQKREVALSKMTWNIMPFPVK